MKKYLNILVITSLMVSSFGLFGKAEAAPEKTQMRNNFGQEVEDLRDEFNQKREEMRQELQDGKISTEDMQTQMEVMQQKREALREEAKQRFEALKESVDKEKDDAKSKTLKARLDRRENAMHRFDNVVENLSALRDRVDAHIAKFKEAGTDVSRAEALSATVDEKLNEVKIKITEVNDLLAKSANSLSAENKASLKTLYSDIQTLVKDIHQNLNDAVKSLRDSLTTNSSAQNTENE